MRAYEFLKEDTTQDVQSNIDLIQQHCKNYLQSVKSAKTDWLYRGTSNKGLFTTIDSAAKYTKDNIRITKDSAAITSRQFSVILQKQGFTATRDNSDFATSWVQKAGAYAGHVLNYDSMKFTGKDTATVYIILPHDNCAYTYCGTPIGTDIVISEQASGKWCVDSKIMNFKSSITQQFTKPLSKKITSFFKTSPDVDLVKLNDYQIMNLLFSIKMNLTDGVMIAGHSIEEWKPVLLQLKGVDLDWDNYIDIDKFNKIFDPQKENLSVALEGRREVYLHGKYYLADYNTYLEHLERLIGID
jgi:hypothetical protein